MVRAWPPGVNAASCTSRWAMTIDHWLTSQWLLLMIHQKNGYHHDNHYWLIKPTGDWALITKKVVVDHLHTIKPTREHWASQPHGPQLDSVNGSDLNSSGSSPSWTSSFMAPFRAGAAGLHRLSQVLCTGLKCAWAMRGWTDGTAGWWRWYVLILVAPVYDWLVIIMILWWTLVIH